MFVDASAIVAILTREDEADALLEVLEAARSPITSPLTVFEAVVGICRKRQSEVEEAETAVRDFLEAARIEVVPITNKDCETALAAFSTFGKAGAPQHNLTGRLFRIRHGEELPPSYSSKETTLRVDIRAAIRIR